jgi:hypothetical protein
VPAPRRRTPTTCAEVSAVTGVTAVSMPPPVTAGMFGMPADAMTLPPLESSANRPVPSFTMLIPAGRLSKIWKFRVTPSPRLTTSR